MIDMCWNKSVPATVLWIVHNLDLQILKWANQISFGAFIDWWLGSVPTLVKLQLLSSELFIDDWDSVQTLVKLQVCSHCSFKIG